MTMFAGWSGRWVAGAALGLVVLPLAGQGKTASVDAPCKACDQAGTDGRDSSGVDTADLSGERIRARVAAPLAVDEGAKGLAQMLVKLRTRASLMLIVAHPDDEDGGMLAYESRGMGVQAAMLTLTRGEGGQNLMSADFNDALGLVRTQELLAAGRYMGVDQMFGTQADFGFSKTKEESLEQWGHERVLYDAVRAVRLYRPLVVAAVFVGGLTDGHGQHQVSGEIAQEVFTAAGDPKVFPDQIAAGLKPWTPLKVYGRVPFSRVTEKGMFDYATGRYEPVRFYNYVTREETKVEPKANVTIPEGEESTVLGMSYVQFARKGLALQKSQIGEGVRTAPRGRADVEYHRFGSRVKTGEQETGFFEGIDVSLVGIASLAPAGSAIHGQLVEGLKQVDGLVGQASAAYTEEHPEKTGPALRDGLAALEGMIAKVATSGLDAEAKANVLHELKVKRVQFNTALMEALGLTLEAKSTDCTSVAPGERVEVEVKVGTPGEASVKGVSVDVLGDGVYGVSGPGLVHSLGVTIPAKMAVTAPAFTRKDLEQPYYTVKDAAVRNAPLPVPPVVAWTTVQYGTVDVRLGSAVMAGGAPLAVVPAISVAVTPAAGVLPLGERRLMLTAHVRSSVDDAKGTVRLELPAGWRSEPASAPLMLAKMGDAKDFAFTVTPVGLAQKSYTLTAVASVGGREYREGYRAVGYTGIEPVNLYAPATYRVVGTDVKVAPGLTVGYLAGTGDSVAMSLKHLGVEVMPLTIGDVIAGKLAGYDAVVLGVRVYAAHPELNGAGSAALQAYAKAGGTVIVQYVTGRYDDADGPYPMSLGVEEKVVEENSKVMLLKPESAVLSWPNRLTTKDFEGWNEERGHGFMGTWDPRYEAVVEMHDQDQEPQKGGLLVARTGKGVWVYCALALYRQLPEGVPGAYRLFANMLSLSKAPGAQ